MGTFAEFLKKLYRVQGWRKSQPVDAATRYPGLVQAGVVDTPASKAEVLIDPPSRSRKKATQIGARTIATRIFRRFRKSKPATWRDVATRMRKYRKERSARLKREKAARRRNGCRRSALAR
jgi:hypothetical protein